jgi:lysyl-tRNA synthetase, class I
MHWADVIAEELIKDDKKHVLATGITPSGPIHIGNMREILTTDAVYRALIKKDANADFIYIADDYDHLRKRYPYLDASYEQYIGMPLSDIPCPCGKHDSYADHYLTTFLSNLEEIGIKPIVYRASDMYKQGMYKDAIQTALEHTKEIRNIIESISKRQLPKKWLPFNIICSSCKKITTATPVLYEYPLIEYKCSCGYEGSVDIREPGVGKLPWRVDWPARWKMLQVTFEPFGKDHATTGGSHQTGEKISTDVFKYPPPAYTVYEFILLKGKGAMHSSKGTGLSATEMLHMTPPEVLRFLIMKNQPNKHIAFDPGFGLLSFVDEYDQFERMFFGDQDQIKGAKDIDTLYELSQPHQIPTKLPIQVPYRHLVTLIQIQDNWEELKAMLQRSNQIPEKISKEDEDRIKQRIDHVRYWLKHFAPASVRFKVQQKLPKMQITSEQKQYLNTFISEAEKISWDAEAIHNLIYSIAEKQDVSAKKIFTTLYQLILNQKNGPRIGYFLSNLEKEFVLRRIKEAVK